VTEPGHRPPSGGAEPAAAGEPVPGSVPEKPSHEILTVPNVLSGLRLLGVPLFLYLVLGPEADGLAVLVLMASGITDYLDGRLARSWGQFTRLGQLLDPLADRLYIASTVIALTIRGVVPVWLLIGLFARDLLLATMLPVLRRHGYGPLPVSFLGKAATFNLLYAFPLLLLGIGEGPLAAFALPVGWAFTAWGVGLYWWAAVLYVRQVRALVVADRARAAGGPSVSSAP
jgi:cardiolipin synthase (CMP-forming)